jgi:hypothetical protein
LGGGIAGAAPTGGASLLLSAVGVSGVTAGWVAVAHGATGVVAGIATIADSISLSKGSGGGKNAQHANMDKKAAAQARYEELKAEYQQLRSTPNKTPEVKATMEKTERAMKKAKQEMDFSGENHSQRAKGQ